MRKIDYHGKNLNIFLAYIAGHKGLFAIDMVCAAAVALGNRGHGEHLRLASSGTSADA